jgi:hypothetical protein
MKSKWTWLLILGAPLLLNACVVAPVAPGYGYVGGPPVVVAPVVRPYGYYGGYGYYGYGRRHW